MDFGKLLNELSQKASETAKDLELDKRIEQGKEIGADVIEKIKTDRFDFFDHVSANLFALLNAFVEL